MNTGIPIFAPTAPKTPTTINTTEIVLIVVAILIAVVFGVLLLIMSHHFTKRKELFIISFVKPVDYIKYSPTSKITDEVVPIVNDIKKQLGVEGLASLDELKDATSKAASWCERGMIDTDFVHVYYIYNKNTSPRTDEGCIDANVAPDGQYYKQSITAAENVEGFLVFAEKPKAGTKYTFAGKDFIVKVPWNGKNWSRYAKESK
jgi:hypothetical protein